MNTLENALLSAGLVNIAQTSEGKRRAVEKTKTRRNARVNRDLLIKELFSARGALAKARKGKRSTKAAKIEIRRVQSLLVTAVTKLRGLV